MTWQRTLEAAFIAGSIAGLLDIGMAALINSVSPLVVLKAIAAGLLGEPAFSGRAGTIVLGLLLQLLMSALIAGTYIIAVERLGGITQPWKCGAAYGIVIFLVMNWIVVPLSAYPYPPKITLHWVLANLAAMIVFGTVLALIVRQWAGSSNAS
jgi:hypothetical protein